MCKALHHMYEMWCLCLNAVAYVHVFVYECVCIHVDCLWICLLHCPFQVAARDLPVFDIVHLPLFAWAMFGNLFCYRGWGLISHLNRHWLVKMEIYCGHEMASMKDTQFVIHFGLKKCVYSFLCSICWCGYHKGKLLWYCQTKPLWTCHMDVKHWNWN